MLIHKDWVYAANPRTASRATEALIIKMLGDEVQVTDTHHPHTNHPALQGGRPVYGVLRNPFDWVVSWFHHHKLPRDRFEEFVKVRGRNWLFKDRLSIYHGYITRPLPYDLGVAKIVQEITGIEPTEAPPVIGVTGPEESLWTPSLRYYVEYTFTEDFYDYRRALNASD